MSDARPQLNPAELRMRNVDLYFHLDRTDERVRRLAELAAALQAKGSEGTIVSAALLTGDPARAYYLSFHADDTAPSADAEAGISFHLSYLPRPASPAPAYLRRRLDAGQSVESFEGLLRDLANGEQTLVLGEARLTTRRRSNEVLAAYAAPVRSNGTLLTYSGVHLRAERRGPGLRTLAWVDEREPNAESTVNLSYVYETHFRETSHVWEQEEDRCRTYVISIS